MALEAMGATFKETQLATVLIAQGFTPKLARQVAEARAADERYVEQKSDRKTLRRRSGTD